MRPSSRADALRLSALGSGVALGAVVLSVSSAWGTRSGQLHIPLEAAEELPSEGPAGLGFPRRPLCKGLVQPREPGRGNNKSKTMRYGKKGPALGKRPRKKKTARALPEIANN